MQEDATMRGILRLTAAVMAVGMIAGGAGRAQAQQAQQAQQAAQPAGAPAQTTAAQTTEPAAAAAGAAPNADLAEATAEAAGLAEEAEKEAVSVPEGDKLRTPDSPAFAILGVSPTTIQNPTTPRDLAVALSGFLKNSELLVPDSLAVEVSPFWFLSHDRLTYADYADNDVGQLWRNFSASLGTTGVAEDGSRSLAVGARTQLAFDSAAGACRAFEKKLQELAGLGALRMSSAAMLELRAKHSPEGVFDDKAFRAALLQLKTEREQAVAEALERAAAVRDECAKAATARPRVLSVAAAVAWRYADSKLENSDFVSQSYWATYAHRFRTWSVLGMSRLQFDEADRGWDGFVDLGARVIVPRRNYAGSIEVIMRKQTFGDDASDSELELRLGLQAEYMIREGTWISVGFGKGFAALDAGELFALANISASFGDPKIER